MTVSIELRPGREVTGVRSAMHGELTWRRDGDRLRITCPVPASVDSLLIE